MASLKAKLRPRNEATRSIRQDERATTKYVNHDIDPDSATALRLQRLFEMTGLTGHRAALVSALAWGSAI